MKIVLGSLLLAGAVSSSGASGAEPARGDGFQVRAATLVLADGSHVAGGIVVVENGKITRVVAPEKEDGTASADPNLPLIEHDGFLSAGLVACQTRSGTRAEATDNTRAFLPEARMAYAFDPTHSDFTAALERGITTVVLAPSDVNVVGGSTAVVKTYGGELLSKEAHMALSFTAAPLGQTVSRSPELSAGVIDRGELEETGAPRRGTRGPTSFQGALAELNARMASGEGALARVAQGEQPVLIEAWDRNEVARAAGFAAQHGLKGALRGASHAGDPALTPLIKASGLAVIVGPFVVGQTRSSLQSVARLQAADIPVAFALDGPGYDALAFRLSAALALSAGAEAQAVMASLTSVGASVAGVGDRVGSIEPGKDADLVLWSGNPLNLASRVEAVYVNGERAFSASKKKD